MSNLDIQPIVCLDPGHYKKYNMCPNNPHYCESEVMWKLTMLQKKYLEILGIKVIVTRDNPDVDLSLSARGAMAKGCDLFISNHSNAVGNMMNEVIDYVAAYHLVDDTTTDVDDISRQFAESIVPVIAKVMETKQGFRITTRKSDNDKNGDGMLNDNYYGVLNAARQVNCPALILEHSFHTNSNVVEWLLNDNNLDLLARKEAECIASFLLKKEVMLDTPSEKIYRVQLGAFANKQNAERLLIEVKKNVSDAFVTLHNGLYKVQVGAFKVQENAVKMLEKMRAYGYFDAFIAIKAGEAANVVEKPERKSNEQVAKEVIDGKHGNGKERMQKLESMGYDYDVIQKIVNSMYK